MYVQWVLGRVYFKTRGVKKKKIEKPYQDITVQQNEKSTQGYQSQIWNRSPVDILIMGEVQLKECEYKTIEYLH